MSERYVPSTLLLEQLEILRTMMPGVHDGLPDSVHDARVATRRIRELLTLHRHRHGRERSEAKSFRRLGRALGRVRDLDVQIALLLERESGSIDGDTELGGIRQDYETRRRERLRRLIKAIERLDVAGLVASPQKLRAVRELAKGHWRRTLNAQVRGRAEAAQAAITHATGVYFPKRVHQVRIAIKKLRYACEVALAGRPSVRDAVLAPLKAVQDTLGELHDRQVLVDAFPVLDETDDARREQLRQARSRFEADVDRLHAEYLDGRERLRLAIEAAAAAAVAATHRSAGGMPRAVKATLAAGAVVGGALAGRRALRSPS